jgi:hypothetical protein
MLFTACSRRLLTAGVLISLFAAGSAMAQPHSDLESAAETPPRSSPEEPPERVPDADEEHEAVPEDQPERVQDAAPSLARYLAAASVGVPLRLTVSDTFDQERVAPIYTDVLAGYVFASSGRWAHGFGLGLSLNLSEDGGFTEPVAVSEQLVVMPAYLLSLRVAPDWFALGHAGVPIALTPGVSTGFELAAALGYRLLAGIGAYTEAGIDIFGGANSQLHASLSLELGLFLDYEVLP